MSDLNLNTEQRYVELKRPANCWTREVVDNKGGSEEPVIDRSQTADFLDAVLGEVQEAQLSLVSSHFKKSRF